MEPNASIWALLVGIDEYRDDPLAGCVNDVEAMRAYLVDDLGVPGQQIATLCNRQASRAAILEVFQGFLIDNAAIRPGDQILFHFSGHGSRMRDPDGIEPDGLNETLVPYDSRTAHTYDIPDKTLAGLLAQLVAAKGSNVTVMLDCCHSGSGTRGAARVRGMAPDLRMPPPGLDGERLAGGERGALHHGWHSPGAAYVLLAACRDRETSREYAAPARDGAPVWYGPLTYFVLQSLGGLPPSGTYADLYDVIAYRINAANRDQMPQCEGDRDRVVFGSARIRRGSFFLIQQLGEQQFQLNGGLIHGIAEGTEFAVYPAPNPRQPPAVAAIGSAVADRTSATRSLVRLSGLADRWPLPLRARIAAQPAHVFRRTVALELADDRQVAEQLRQAIAAGASGAGLAVQAGGDPAAPADLRVRSAGGWICILDGNDRALLDLPRPSGPQPALALLAALEGIVRYQRVLALANQNASRLSGTLRLRLWRMQAEAGGLEAAPLGPEAITPAGAICLEFDERRRERNLYGIELSNHSPLAVYPHIFVLGADYGISRLYPTFGQEEMLEPGHALAPHRDRFGGGCLEIYLPDGVDIQRDLIKAIVTTEACDLGWLEQDPAAAQSSRRSGAGSPPSLDGLLGELLGGAAGGRNAGAGGDWGSVELGLSVVRAGAAEGWRRG